MPVKFVWDRGNNDKNWRKHRVTNRECEEVFFDKRKKVAKDRLHSEKEERFVLVGQTQEGRTLYITLTMRGKKIRVISARDLNKRKEAYLYEKTA